MCKTDQYQNILFVNKTLRYRRLINLLKRCLKVMSKIFTVLNKILTNETKLLRYWTKLVNKNCFILIQWVYFWWCQFLSCSSWKEFYSQIKLKSERNWKWDLKIQTRTCLVLTESLYFDISKPFNFFGDRNKWYKTFCWVNFVIP